MLLDGPDRQVETISDRSAAQRDLNRHPETTHDVP